MRGESFVWCKEKERESTARPGTMHHLHNNGLRQDTHTHLITFSQVLLSSVAINRECGRALANSFIESLVVTQKDARTHTHTALTRCLTATCRKSCGVAKATPSPAKPSFCVSVIYPYTSSLISFPHRFPSASISLTYSARFCCVFACVTSSSLMTQLILFLVSIISCYLILLIEYLLFS